MCVWGGGIKQFVERVYVSVCAHVLAWVHACLHVRACVCLDLYIISIEVCDDSDKVGADVVLLHGCPQSCMPNPVEGLLKSIKTW